MVKLELSIVEAHHVRDALRSYIDSGVYGSQEPSWRELLERVDAKLYETALEYQHGRGYRRNDEDIMDDPSVLLAAIGIIGADELGIVRSNPALKKKLMR